MSQVVLSGVTRALIGGGGGCIFIYSCSARRISFEIKFISKEICRAEHEYMNIHPPPPPINALVTPLVVLGGVTCQIICTNIGDFANVVMLFI